MASDASLWITIGIPSGISVLALIVSIYAAVQNRKANKNAGNANAIATSANDIATDAKDIAEQALDKQGSALKFQDAALENQIYSSINTALQFMIQAAVTLGATDPNSSNYGVVQQCYNTTVEGWLNAYETACLSYRNDKINKDTFKKGYQDAIRKLLQRHDLKDYFYPKETSGYLSIHEVYHEWERADK
ncbi:hypothetical protein ACTQHD_19920 [Citrobacter freundii]|uniref:hypothetical protein n=1 Tax=Citrobacter TaxID=544 RepID=UPI00109C1989|nr:MULTISPECIES: hypothetical protein [Citrobacter]EBS1368544.1 hypothetical protein [Salmonella enterica subsp. enterica serovar Virchow]MBM3011232.1 hypothetical protein [Citrobacter freundii]MBY1059834.1 hypothetical protein [Citrobacter europaeus]MDN4196369.1 hypothetical protein [Citrobacter freundii]MDN4226857.1 hypothetical protein [Citrobacter freundii]